MPFFKIIHKIKFLKVNCVHLQVQGQIHKKILIKRKRVYPFTSKGSITIEAAMAITVFMGLVLFVLGFAMMVNTQFSLQMKINNIAMVTAKGKFYLELADKITDYNDNLKNLKNDITEGKNKIMQSGFLNGIKNTQYSENQGQDGMVDIELRYSLKTPVLNRYVAVVQRSMVKDWTGKDITKMQNIVYITPNGKVYHTTRECSHLSLKIRKIYYREIQNLKNIYGEKYSKCFICAKNKISSQDGIFVTEDGNRYHKSLTCSGLTRNVISVSRDSIKDMPVCSGCGGKDK